MKSTGVTALLITLSARLAVAQAPDASTQARRNIGQVATLCGVVVEHRCLANEQRAGQIALDRRLEDRNGVTVEITAANRTAFPSLFEWTVESRRVCATGIVEQRDRRYVVSIASPAQIVVEGGASS